MNHALTSIRISAATLTGLLIMAALFAMLQSMTVLTYVPQLIKPEKIIFTRQHIESGIETRRDIAKPERPPILEVEPPPSIAGDDTRIQSPVAQLDPRVDTRLPPPEALAIGSDRDVVPLVRIPPEYPLRALTRGIGGWVQVRFNISPTGSVTDAEVVASEPAGVFDQATLDAISRWRYNPMVQDGVAVERRGVQTVLRYEVPE